MSKNLNIARFVGGFAVVLLIAACSSPTDVRVPKEIEEEDPDPDTGDKGAFLLGSEVVRFA